MEKIFRTEVQCRVLEICLELYTPLWYASHIPFRQSIHVQSTCMIYSSRQSIRLCLSVSTHFPCVRFWVCEDSLFFSTNIVEVVTFNRRSQGVPRQKNVTPITLLCVHWSPMTTGLRVLRFPDMCDKRLDSYFRNISRSVRVYPTTCTDVKT